MVTLSQIVNDGYTGFTGSQGVGVATGGGSDKIFWLNDQTVTTSYSIPSQTNAITAGPITVNNGATVTVPSGSRWVIV